MAKQNTKGGGKSGKAAKTTKKRKVIVESVGEAHIAASFNNILISLTNKAHVRSPAGFDYDISKAKLENGRCLPKNFKATFIVF